MRRDSSYGRAILAIGCACWLQAACSKTSPQVRHEKTPEELIAVLGREPWLGPSPGGVPLHWYFNLTPAMEALLEMGPATQDALIAAMSNREIRPQLILLLGGIGDEKAVPHIIDAMVDESAWSQPPGPEAADKLTLTANIALTNITAANVIFHHGGGVYTWDYLRPHDSKRRWSGWWEGIAASFSPSDPNIDRNYTNYPGYGIYRRHPG